MGKSLVSCFFDSWCICYCLFCTILHTASCLLKSQIFTHPNCTWRPTITIEFWHQKTRVPRLFCSTVYVIYVTEIRRQHILHDHGSCSENACVWSRNRPVSQVCKQTCESSRLSWIKLTWAWQVNFCRHHRPTGAVGFITSRFEIECSSNVTAISYSNAATSCNM